MAFRNYMEEAVIEELSGVLEQLEGACKCERCRENMVTYALNRLPAKYASTLLGDIYTKLHQVKAQSRTDITVKLMEAARVVKAHPRH